MFPEVSKTLSPIQTFQFLPKNVLHAFFIRKIGSKFRGFLRSSNGVPDVANFRQCLRQIRKNAKFSVIDITSLLGPFFNLLENFC